MKAKIRNLIKNPRYRLLEIEGNHFLIDFGSQFWKIIFPFFTWIFPNDIYKVDDPDMVNQLKAPMKKKKKDNGSWLPLYGGLGVLIPNLTGSLVDYFDISLPLWLNVMLLVIALLSVVILFQTFNHMLKQKLYSTVQLESLSRYRIRLHPKSFGHVVKLIAFYVFILTFSVFTYVGYVQIQNVFLLFSASLFLFVLLVGCLFPGEEGTTTVTFKENNKQMS